MISDPVRLQRPVNSEQVFYASPAMPPANTYGMPVPYGSYANTPYPPGYFPPAYPAPGSPYGPPVMPVTIVPSAMLVPAARRTLSDAFEELPGQFVRIVKHISVVTFVQEMSKAGWSITWIQLLILAFFSSLIFTVAGLFDLAIKGTTLTTAALVFGVVFMALLTFGAVIGLFFVWEGILYGCARLFGGQGTFLAQSYATLLFLVPVGIATDFLIFIPVVGIFLGLAALVYLVVLQVFVVMAAHRLSGGKATAAVLGPIGAAIVCVSLFAVLLAVLH